ncbi:TPA: AAA family ATPase [Serratia fonticola]|nr:AAA family ATPase [Serratia fonticola]
MTAIIERLKEVMHRKGYNQSDIARAIGKSPAVISAYLNAKYTGDVKNLEEELVVFIQRETDKDRIRRVLSKYVPTSMASHGLEVARMAHLDCDINVITGAAGLGKTMILREYATRYRDAILIEADPGYTARVLLEELCNRLGQSKRGNMHELSESCITALRDSGRVILIDEAELLPYRALEVLRRIHDKAGVGVVLAGMPRLIINLKGRRGEFAQLYSRVGFALDLGEQLPQEDLLKMLISMVPEAENIAVGEAFCKAAKGNARRMFKLARGVSRASEINQKPIDKVMINKFTEMLIN